MNIGPKPQIENVESWKILFTTLLAQFFTMHGNQDFDVKINDSTIEILSTNVMLLDALANILEEPTHLRKYLNYTIQTEQVETIEERLVNLKFDFSSLSAEILKEIFSEKLLNTCGLFPLGTGADDKELCTIRFKIENSYGFRKLWKGRLNIFSTAIAGASLPGLRRVLLGEDKPVCINTKDKKADLCDAFKEIVGIRRISGQSEDEEFFLNYGELLKLIFPCPPQIRKTVCETGKSKIELDKFKLLSYLNQLFTEGFVLHVEGDIATPICLAPINLIRMNNLYSLVLDCSASMKKQFSGYMNHVRAFIEKILEHGRERDVISITKFNTKTESFKFQLTGNIEEDKQEIFEKLRRFVAEGQTRLRGTIIEELTVILREYPDYNKSMTIFSDGNETVHDIEEVELCHKMNELNLNRNYGTPKVYSLGLGDEYAREFFEKWAINTGAKHFCLGDDISGFAELLEYFQEMERPRQLYHFMQDLNSVVSVFEGSVHHDPSIRLKASKDFSCNEQNYQFELRITDEHSLFSEQNSAYTPAFQNTQRGNTLSCAAPLPDPTIKHQERCSLF